MVSATPSTPSRPRHARAPTLNLPLDKVSFIILKAREYDVKESDSDPDEGSNAIDDGETDVLTDNGEDPVREELLGAIRSLNDDERIRLVALAWIGRGLVAYRDFEKLDAIHSQPCSQGFKFIHADMLGLA